MDQTLSWALNQFAAIQGTRHASLLVAPAHFVTTLPEERHAAVRALGAAAGQMFSALRNARKSHNEAFFEYADEMVAVLQINPSILVILGTEKRGSMPMLSIAARSIAAIIHEAGSRPFAFA